jgi:hypothetical protein
MGSQMRLSTVQEIERAIRALKPEELEELYSWLDQTARNQLTLALSPILRLVGSTTLFIALWTTKSTVAYSRFSHSSVGLNEGHGRPGIESRRDG